ncbi:Uncharacterized protein CK203_091749 [Vitis vinifera]|uniref:Nucleotide-diphospho-sugar transferase domain-containing protein n=1 Tax=Vitis vinifera TaxID=29760 RepID=A0A438EJC5_VITVI|nr:Uncharacterized protein CK203_091749 [Vitis vinifera]
MEDHTVILTTLNEAWAAPDSVIDLFLESFRIGDHTRRYLNHLVIIALDQKAFARCLILHTHCFTLVTEGVDFSGEAYFMTSDYLKMMWRRIDFLRSVLEMGYNFIFSDGLCDLEAMVCITKEGGGICLEMRGGLERCNLMIASNASTVILWAALIVNCSQLEMEGLDEGCLSSTSFVVLVNGAAKGLRINLNKSTHFGINTSHDQISNLALMLGCTVSDRPLMYLVRDLSILAIYANASSLAWNLIFLRNLTVPFHPATFIWKSKVSSKVKAFAWLVAHKKDADIMWFRDPFPHFLPNADFQIACDHFLGDPYNVNNRPNGGFNYVKSNNRSIEFYKFWYSSRETYPGLHDQDVLNIIKFDPFIMNIGLEMRFLGYCTTLGGSDWKEYMSLPPSLKRSSEATWRVPQNCSLDALQSIQLYDSKDKYLQTG